MRVGFSSLLFFFLIYAASVQAADQPVLELSSIYATSVKSDYLSFGPQNLFDGKPSVWATMPGAGNNEGVMLYVSERFSAGKKPVSLNVASVMLKSAEGSYNRVKSAIIYVDGARVAEGGADSRIAINAENPNSIYIRLESVEGYEAQSLPAVDIDRSVIQSKTTRSAALSEVELFDAAGVPFRVVVPRIEKGAVSASSILDPKNAYAPDLLFDAKSEFGWAEGSKGSGEGESLTFDFSKKMKIDRIRYRNGYQRSAEHFKANARIKDFRFGPKGSEKKLLMSDRSAFEELDVDSKSSSTHYSLFIDSVYPGTKYKDLVLSELQFHDADGWFTLLTPDAEKRKSELIAAVKGTVIAQYLDRSFSEYYSDVSENKNSSFVFRSNGSFAVWLESEGDENVSKVFDGNWEIISSGKDSAKLKIFGKMILNRRSVSPYSSGVDINRTAIFSDTVTIDGSGISAAKWFGRISIK